MAPDAASPYGTRRRDLLIGFALFLASLILRGVGIGWGLPNDIRNQSLHPDEPVIWMYAQQLDPLRGDFDPSFYQYPTLYLTALKVASSVVSYYAPAPAQGPESEWRMIGRDHLVGRWISALSGAMLAWCMYCVLRRRTNRFGAVLGAALLMIAPGLVVHSRFQTTDMLALLLMTLSLFWALELIPEENAEGEQSRSPLAVRSAALAGVFAGLSAGAKYPNALVLVAILVACILAPKGRRALCAAIACLCAVMTFVVATPGVLVSWAKFSADFRYEMIHSATGHGLVFAETPSGFIYHIANLATGLGVMALILGSIGLLVACFQRHRWAFALVAFAFVFYILIGRAEVKFLRYAFPLMPVLAIGFGWLMGFAHSQATLRWRAVVALGFFALAGLCGGGGLVSTLQMTVWMVREDLRDTIARRFKSLPGPAVTVGLVSDPWFYTPPFFPDTGLPRAVPFEQRHALMLQAKHPKVARYVPADPNQRLDWDIRLLTEIRPDYVVISSFEASDVARLLGRPIRDPNLSVLVARAKEFRDILAQRYRLDSVYGADAPAVHDLMYIRPTIWVWKKLPTS